ncbi:hypothetical protein P43SY_002022 [Pythium insidiosum]|uniref:Uncharacterized protein n=1 Tax=Pythium insidiosum TaxID=114742 RepID=A0AAD5LEP1_PYTIN|nr:hypothetical protein ATCC90586_005115 [Pythium insidiosum]KAJ0395891.1 hypothetical protein P43SY_002022 [Pythium insidiosum]
MGRLLDGLMRPGSREFVILLNCVLGLLFFVMLTVIYTQLEDSFHVFVLLFIIVGLTLSINWFIIEANKLKELQAAEGSTLSGDAAKPDAKAERPKTD